MKDGLPKIAIARLKAKPEGPTPSGASALPVVSQVAEHPDANLLAAFAEQALTEKERTKVLNHLSQCPDCREIAALAQPVESPVLEPVPVAARRSWTTWPALRWGAMAAALGALSVVIVLHPGMRKGHQQLSQTQLPAPVGTTTSAPAPVSAPPLPQALPESPRQAEAQLEAKKSTGHLASAGRESGTQLALNDQLTRAKARQQATLMAASRPPVMYRSQSVSGARVEQEVGQEEKALAAPAVPAPLPPPAPGAASTAASEDTAKAAGGLQIGAAESSATAQNAGVAGGNIAPSPQAAAANATRHAADQSAFRAAAPMAQVRMYRTAAAIGAGQPSALWSVTPDGKVQRSLDGGKTFQQISVAPGVRFWVATALGNDVWAGGAGGALYHSANGGATWNRVSISFEGNGLSDTITSIQLRDPQHLTVTTASGSSWVSQDGGQHWQKQP